MSDARADELLNAILDGEASESDLAEFQSLIDGNEQLAAELADGIANHRLLGYIHRPFDSESFIDSVMASIQAEQIQTAQDIATLAFQENGEASVKIPTRAHSGFGAKRNRRSAIVLGGTLLSMVVLAVIAIFNWERFGGPDSPRESNFVQSIPRETAVSVATLLLEKDSVWSSEMAFTEGERLHAGTIELESGVAVLRFDGGAELVMSGETSVVLRTAGMADLRYGNVVIRAENGAEGFELGTPASPLIDLGTEFAVRVDRKGATELHVLDGDVEYRDGQVSNVVSAGKAIRFAGPKSVAQTVACNALGFEEIILQVNPKPQPRRMIVYEGFHYEPGEIALEETTRGKGWAGPWRKRLPEERKFPDKDASPNTFDIVHGQLNVTWPVPGGRKGMLKLPGGHMYYVRPLSRTIDLDRDGVLFFSLMVRETERRTDSTRPYERLRLTFRSSENYHGESVSFGHGPGYRPKVQTGGGISHTSPMVLPGEQTTLWIGKIVSRKSGEDEIYFRVYGEDDVLGYAEPATWHVVTRGAELDAHLDRVLISSIGKTARIIDELRIGPTWRSVAPMEEKR